MTVYQRTMKLIGDEWIRSSALLQKLGDKDTAPHKGTLSRALTLAFKRGLIECQPMRTGNYYEYAYRRKSG